MNEQMRPVIQIPNLPQVKHFLSSKTMWFGFVTSGLSFLTWLGGQSWVQENPQWVSFIGIAIGAATMVLRGLTTTGVTTSK